MANVGQMTPFGVAPPDHAYVGGGFQSGKGDGPPGGIPTVSDPWGSSNWQRDMRNRMGMPPQQIHDQFTGGAAPPVDALGRPVSSLGYQGFQGPVRSTMPSPQVYGGAFQNPGTWRGQIGPVPSGGFGQWNPNFTGQQVGWSGSGARTIYDQPAGPPRRSASFLDAVLRDAPRRGSAFTPAAAPVPPTAAPKKKKNTPYIRGANAQQQLANAARPGGDGPGAGNTYSYGGNTFKSILPGQKVIGISAGGGPIIQGSGGTNYSGYVGGSGGNYGAVGQWSRPETNVQDSRGNPIGRGTGRY